MNPTLKPVGNHLNLNGSNDVAQEILRQHPELATPHNVDVPV